VPYPGETSRTGKTTSSGIAYTEIAFTIGSDACLAAVPANPSSTLALVGHGHGGSEQTINGVPFVATLDRMIASGWLVVSTDAAGNGWGNDASINAYVAAWTWARANLGTKRTILYGQSMGAQVLANVLHRGLVTDQVAFVSIDGALSLATAHASGSYQAAVRTAYGIASDGSDYAAKTAGHDAALLPAAGFSGTRMLLEASTGDTAIPKTSHTDVFAANVAGQPAQLVQLTGSGAHVTADNYFPTDVHAFLAPKVTRLVSKPMTVVVDNRQADSFTKVGEVWRPVTTHAVIT
jgi:pimeloyl-ACP methyl ester carboxylesterase